VFYADHIFPLKLIHHLKFNIVCRIGLQDLKTDTCLGHSLQSFSGNHSMASIIAVKPAQANTRAQEKKNARARYNRTNALRGKQLLQTTRCIPDVHQLLKPLND
jgi:hypothetical protein